MIRETAHLLLALALLGLVGRATGSSIGSGCVLHQAEARSDLIAGSSDEIFALECPILGGIGPRSLGAADSSEGASV